ncbi:MAG: tRNA guanosine(34) transglycosylase Tgt [Actinomycetota bacterium]
MAFSFSIEKTARKARLGRLVTSHGEVETPVFMPVGSKAAVRTMTPEDLKDAGASLILANAYHLYLRPGTDVIRKFGGLHDFMRWDGPILTDSGGYQVFSLSHTLKVNDEGVRFTSPIDGSEHFLTPEDIIDIQVAIGSDIAMVLDECPPYPADRAHIKRACARTRDWAARSKTHSGPTEDQSGAGQALFGIVQGGVYADLRRESAEAITALDFAGYGIGGLSVGEPKEAMLETLAATLEHLPADKPRYLMGVGDPEGIAKAIELGVDMFDCVMPTRIARNGTAFTREGRLNILNAKNTADKGPLDEGCGCYTCRTFSRAYVKHLYKTGETLALKLLTCHNLYFVFQLIERVKTEIKETLKQGA